MSWRDMVSSRKAREQPRGNVNKEPGFEYCDGDLEGSGSYNQTTVDIIAVPCIGADPIGAWTRKPSNSDPKHNTRKRSKPSEPWICYKVRRETPQARVLLYRHRESVEGMKIETAADDLIQQIAQMRESLKKGRPIFFICHSIGGLVVKLALVKAWTQEQHKSLVYDCHGITFFATPHRGSGRLSTPNLAKDIQRLLSLKKPLPWSIINELGWECKPLLELHNKFINLTREMRLWTFYETVDSKFSHQGGSDPDEAYFTSAPIASIRSSLIGLTAERVFSLSSDHASCASFGDENDEAMSTYLHDFGNAVRKAISLTTGKHTPLHLSTKVKVELTGFYEDCDGDSDDHIRLRALKPDLGTFLSKSLDEYLPERLAPTAHLVALPSSNKPAADPAGAPLSADAARGSSQQVPGSSQPSSEHRGLRVPFQRRRRPYGSGPSAAPASTPPLGARPNTSKVAMASLEPDVKGPASAVPRRRHSVSSLLGDDGHGIGSSQEGHIGGIGRRMSFQESKAGVRSTRKFMWIHLPFNNPYWVKCIFDVLSKTGDRKYSKLLDYDYWTSKQVQGRRSYWHVSYVKPGCALVPAETNTFSRNISLPHFYLYLPYLHYDTYVNIIRRRSIIKRRKEQGRARPVPKWIAEHSSLEFQTIWQFIMHDHPLHIRRTLDQYGYPALPNTWARDDDQMLYKLTKQKTANLKDEPESIEEPGAQWGNEIINGNVLMVDQLWLWVVDNTTLMTFFPTRESRRDEGLLFQHADLRNSIYSELNEDLKRQCKTAFDLAALVTLHAVTVLIDRSSHPDLDIFGILSEAFGILTENLILSLKRFRTQHFSKNSDAPRDNRPKTIKERYKKERERAEQQDRENTSAMLELRDMDDELHILINLFMEQKNTIESMKNIAEIEYPKIVDTGNFVGSHGFTTCGCKYLNDALQRLEEYLKQANEMTIRVESTRKDYEKLQQMIQRQAQVDGVRWSQLQADLANSQKLSVTIFTVFTVIFLPLSFFTSLFGMNTQEWGGPDENNFPSLKLIGVIALPSSFLLIAITLIAALSGRAQLVIQTGYTVLPTAVELCARSFRALVDRLRRFGARSNEYERLVELIEKDFRDMRQMIERNERHRYEFWESVRAKTRSGYEIPEMNRSDEYWSGMQL